MYRLSRDSRMISGRWIPIALAYIGDAVYEVYVRQHVMTAMLQTSIMSTYKKAVAFVRADGQAFAIKKFVRERQYRSSSEGAFRLTDDEAAIVRRARNHKSASAPRNTDLGMCKRATAFWSAGRMILTWGGETERLDVMIKETLNAIEKERSKK